MLTSLPPSFVASASDESEGANACKLHDEVHQFIISRFTCLKIAVLFTGSIQAVLFFSNYRRKKGFQPIKGRYFC